MMPSATVYKPLSWQQAFDRNGARLQTIVINQVEFYTSGRTSNEAAFLYQLLPVNTEQ